MVTHWQGIGPLRSVLNPPYSQLILKYLPSVSIIWLVQSLGYIPQKPITTEPEVLGLPRCLHRLAHRCVRRCVRNYKAESVCRWRATKSFDGREGSTVDPMSALRQPKRIQVFRCFSADSHDDFQHFRSVLGRPTGPAQTRSAPFAALRMSRYPTL